MTIRIVSNKFPTFSKVILILGCKVGRFYCEGGQMKKLTILISVFFNFYIMNNLCADINYPDFSSIAELNLVGNCTVQNNRLRLTPPAQNMTGAAWHINKESIQNGFETVFQFQITGLAGYGADGFACVIQNHSDSALGIGPIYGSGLGYETIPNSIAIEFDTYYNMITVNDPNDNHVSIQTRGIEPNNPEHIYSLGCTTGIPDISNGSIYTVRIEYISGTMKIYLNDFINPVLVISIDVSTTLNLDNGKSWVGFTAASGADYENHYILNWTFVEYVDGDNDGILNHLDNCPNISNPSQEDTDADHVGNACDNCPDVPNPTQEDTDNDKIGNACDPCPNDFNNDSDLDTVCGDIDNCPSTPNGSTLGTCAKLAGGVIVGMGVTCLVYEDCNEDEYCQLEQGDCNDNGIGDACECYADVNCSTKVDLSDLVIMKGEFLQTCPCQADCNGDNQVNLGDLVIMKSQFLRSGCPACP